MDRGAGRVGEACRAGEGQQQGGDGYRTGREGQANSDAPCHRTCTCRSFSPGVVIVEGVYVDWNFDLGLDGAIF
jgi:hypothetical protein